MSTAIKIENVSKLYRLGTVGTGTISHDLNRWWHTIRGKEDPYAKVGQTNDRTKAAASDEKRETRENTGDSSPLATRNSPLATSPDYVWALKDINLEVAQGEILGIIGRNGAGKSTLLKLLSRVTAPTTGSIKTKGRIASLLEVGTGFHPELTGRENIYMNGAILGMRRHEITRRLDEIVEFSGCVKYLDTPTKRYSSGMTVRLGFAVAAHLDCEILVVDEVLAVGDAEFQRKCIARMQSVSSSGRTVLFVSHNLQSVKSLCSRAILLKNGGLSCDGEVETIIASHMMGDATNQTSKSYSLDDAPGDTIAKLLRLELVGNDKMLPEAISTSTDLGIALTILLNEVPEGLCIGFDLMKDNGTTILRSFNTDGAQEDWPKLKVGVNTLHCIIPRALLNCGTYLIKPRIGIHNRLWIVNGDEGLVFETEVLHGSSPLWVGLNSQRRPGCIAPILLWH